MNVFIKMILKVYKSQQERESREIFKIYTVWLMKNSGRKLGIDPKKSNQQHTS